MNRSGLCLLIIVAISSQALADARPPKGQAPLITMEQALKMARSNNESFQVAIEQLRQAKLVRDRAWAALLPTLRASGSFTHSDREITREFQGQKVVFLRQDAFSGSLSASLVLLKGSAIPGILGSHRLADAAEQTRRWTHNLLDYEVARAYFATLAAQNLVLAAERTLASAEEHLAAARTRRQVGEAIAVDVTRARIEVVSARAELVRTRNTVTSSIDYLAFLIGTKPPISVSSPKLPLPDRDAKPAPGGSPLERPDVRAGRLRVEAARRDVTGSWLDYLPTLTLSGTYQATQNTGFSGDADSWNVVLSLDWLLIDGGMRRATRLERASRLKELSLAQRQLERQVALDVRQAWRDLGTTRSSLATARERLELARENRELVLSRYRAGLGTSLELVEADDALSQAEVSMIAEELNLALVGLDLLKTLGRGPRGKALDPS